MGPAVDESWAMLMKLQHATRLSRNREPTVSQLTTSHISANYDKRYPTGTAAHFLSSEFDYALHDTFDSFTTNPCTNPSTPAP